VGEGHISGAKFVENSQRCRRIFDHVAAFHAEQAGDASCLVDTLNVIGRACLLEVWLAPNHSQGNIKFAHCLVQ
jgi:hypothetical protein